MPKLSPCLTLTLRVALLTLLSSCGSENSTATPVDPLLAANPALADGVPAAPQPLIASEESPLFRVADQHGCWWNITSGRKFDSQRPVTTPDGMHDCSGTPWPSHSDHAAAARVRIIMEKQP